MKIWIINHYASHPYRGSSTRHFGIARRLAKLGNDVTIIASNAIHGTQNSNCDFNDNQRWLVEEIKGVRFIWLGTRGYKGNGLGRILDMVQFALNLLWNHRKFSLETPDVIVGSTPDPFAALAAKILAHIYHCAYAYEIRDLWPELLIEIGGYSRGNPAILALAAIEGFLAKRSNAIIPLLPGVPRYLERYGVPSVKTFVVSNGVEPDWAPPFVAKMPGERFTITYAGTMGHVYGLEHVIGAAKILKDRGHSGDIRFAFFGGGPVRSALEVMTREMRLDEMIDFHDAVPKIEILKYLRASDALLSCLRPLPLYRYGISLNKVYDYLLAGRPIISAVASLNDPAIEAGGGIAAKPADSVSIADAVLKVFKMPLEERNRLGECGHHYAMLNFTYEALAITYAAALKFASDAHRKG